MADMHLTSDQLKHRFQFHPADAQNTQEAHEQVREVLLEAADRIVGITGAMSREQSLAVTKLEECMFWANAAIARGDGPRA
jgi:3-deoxy-D-arabino-heptulosonate 7-phosphate (DAHP) synthase